jgi:hypothetical protein
MVAPLSECSDFRTMRLRLSIYLKCDEHEEYNAIILAAS